MNNTEEILDECFDSFHGLLSNNQFNFVDYLLTVLDPTMETEVALGILTITAPWKEQLSNGRKLFFDKVLEYLIHEYGPEVAHKTLDRLG